MILNLNIEPDIDQLQTDINNKLRSKNLIIEISPTTEYKVIDNTNSELKVYIKELCYWIKRDLAVVKNYRSVKLKYMYSVDKIVELILADYEQFRKNGK